MKREKDESEEVDNTEEEEDVDSALVPPETISFALIQY